VDVYTDVINGLKEDMGVELENLRLLYEEEKLKGIEKIKEKYSKYSSYS
jgi:hypothetical protein